MPPKINSKTKTLDGSAPTTPIEASAPDTKLNGRNETEDGGQSVSRGMNTRSQRGKEKGIVDRTICKGNGETNCGKKVLNDELGGVECELCFAWYHPGCQGLNMEAYGAVRKNALFWICIQCRKFIPKFRNMVQGTTTGQPESEHLARIEQKVDDLSKVFSEQKIAASEALSSAEEAKKLFADVVKNGDTTSDQAKILTNENIQKCFEKFQTEKEEQEKRKCNIVASNLPESEAPSGEERKREDVTNIVDIIKDELRLNVRVENAFRAGKKQENRPRILIVTLKSEASKWDVLKTSKLLRESENEVVRNIYINKDLTVQEREQQKKLRDEVKARRAQGENVKIVKGKCVKIRDQSKMAVEARDQGHASTERGTKP